MLQKDQIYELNLEDYSLPRYKSDIKPYYGTMSEIIEMMNRLEDNPETDTALDRVVMSACR